MAPERFEATVSANMFCDRFFLRDAMFHFEGFGWPWLPWLILASPGWLLLTLPGLVGFGWLWLALAFPVGPDWLWLALEVFAKWTAFFKKHI